MRRSASLGHQGGRAPASAALHQEGAEGILIASALVGTLAIEAGLIGRTLAGFQSQLGDMLLRVELSDDDIESLQLLDQLTQRIADLAAVLDEAGQSLDGTTTLPVAPLLAQAKLAHTKALVAGLDLTRQHTRLLGEHGDPSEGDDITFF